MIRNLKQQVSWYRSHRKQYILAKIRGKPVYDEYFFIGKECFIKSVVCVAIVFFLSYFFYRSFIAVLLLSPIGIFLYRYLEKNAAKKKKAKLESEFKDCLTYVSANLRAGYALENAFVECIKEMENLNGKDSIMVTELRNLQKELAFNIQIEDYFIGLGNRSNIENIREFGDIIRVAKKNGGNLPKIVRDCAFQIMEQISVREEIETAISGKVYEQRIMNIVPFAIYFYVEATNGGYFDSLYHNLTGCFIMTICLFLYSISYFLSEKIVTSVG